jgi:hypothetical protein
MPYEETILKAKVFMRGKKMGWVGSVLNIYSHPIDMSNLEILCEGARHVLLSQSRDPHRLLRVSGKATKTPTTRTLALHYGLVSHVADMFPADGNPSNLLRIAERTLSNGFGTAWTPKVAIWIQLRVGPMGRK